MYVNPPTNVADIQNNTFNMAAHVFVFVHLNLNAQTVATFSKKLQTSNYSLRLALNVVLTV